VTRRPSKDLAKEEDVDGVRVYRILPSGDSSRLRWALVLTSIPTLIRKRKEYDIIFVPGFRALGLTAVIMGKLLGKKSVLKAESSGELSGSFFTEGFEKFKIGKGSSLARAMVWLRNRILVRADVFVSMSGEQTTEFTGQGVDPAKIVMISQSVNVERFFPVSSDEKAAMRAKLGLPADHTIVIFTGRIVSYKGVPRLLDVWNDIRETFPKATLVMAGAGGMDAYNCEAEARKFVKDHNLSDRVIMTGSVNNVDEYLKAADIYALPTENEAFPLALLEGMACGLPPISTDVGGLPDILEHEKNGLVTEPGNTRDLKKCVERLLTDVALREKLGEAAYKTVRERYTLDIITQKCIDLFESLCDSEQ
ncbi:MAG: glycosyltransferase family 4 protein, partial [Verrucomicrobia bacterium]|nr:glycosyltransferase family 4 protein [Verrucomicrobiota bacterium]